MIAKKEDNFELINPRVSFSVLNEQVGTDNLEVPKHFWLYALKLEGDKYYVGMTSRKNPYDRIIQHGNHELSNYSASWTKKYSPEQVLEIRDIGVVTKSQAKTLEHQLTLAYMKTYGYKKVRGGQITYPGNIWKIWDRYFWGTGLELLIASVLLILISSIYLIEHFGRRF